RKILNDSKNENRILSTTSHLKSMSFDRLAEYNSLTAKTDFLIFVALLCCFVALLCCFGGFYFLVSSNFIIVSLFFTAEILIALFTSKKWRYLILVIRNNELILGNKKEYYLYMFKDINEKEKLLGLHKKVLFYFFLLSF
ncbi:MAG: hypothetical protein ACK5NA_07570, partial [Enterococcus sp.]